MLPKRSFFSMHLASLLSLGFDPNLAATTNKKIQLANKLALFFFHLTLFFAIVRYVVVGEKTLLLDIYFLLGWATVPLLNKFNFYNLSRMVTIIHFNVLLFVVSSLMGPDKHVQFGFYPVAVLGLVLFESRNKWAILFSIIFPVTNFMILKLTNFQFIYSFTDLKPLQGAPVLINEAAGFVATFAVVYYFFRSFESLVEKLEKSQAGLSEAQQLALIGSWDWDLKARTHSWSKEFQDLIQSPSNITEHTFRSFVKNLLPSDRSLVIQGFRELLDHPGSQQMEVRYTKEKSEVKTLFLRARSIQFNEGKIERIHGTLQDVTELRDAQRIIEEQKAKIIAASKMSSLGEMAGGMAHEINTPLGVIKLHAGQLLRLVVNPVLDTDAIRVKSETIVKMVDLVSRVIKGLQSFSRGGEKDPFETTSLRGIVEDTLVLSSARFKHHEVDLQIDEIPADLTLECRSTQIAQVLLNLMNNAFDAVVTMEEKWIKISCSEADEWIQIRVTDSGKGIPEELKGKLMQPFFTTKEVGKGTGLGLSISKGILESHGGQIRISVDSPNTSFVIELPKKQKILKSTAA